MGFFQNLFGNGSAELRQLLSQGAVILDVRTPEEYKSGHIAGSRNIPLDTLPARISEIRQIKKPLVTVCQSGMRSSTARSFLESQGIPATNGGSWSSVNRMLN